MDWLRIYFEFIEGIFAFCTLEFMASLGNEKYTAENKNLLRFFFIFIAFIWAIPEEIPFSTYIEFSLNFLYMYFVSSHNLKCSVIQFFKYEIYSWVTTFLLFPLLYLATNNFSFAADSSFYFNYKSLICSAISYILLCLFIYTKRFLSLRPKKLYGLLFFISILLSIFLLNYIGQITIVKRYDALTILTIVFSFIFIIIAVCLTGYGHMLAFLEENAKQQILISKYELESDYYKNITSSMDSFHMLRHDFKNHLIMLSSYAASKDYDKLQTYLHNINRALSETHYISTPHNLTSAILNVKFLQCQQKQIFFSHKCRFASIYISDFHLITILGNILDNAITASEKMEQGEISFTMEQIDTYLSIVCQNNHREIIQKKNGVFISTKSNAGIFHGLGIKNIQSSVSALNGSLDIQYTDTLFTISILLPNYI